MSKAAKILGVTALVGGLGVAAYFILKPKKPVTPTPTPRPKQPDNTQNKGTQSGGGDILSKLLGSLLGGNNSPFKPGSNPFNIGGGGAQGGKKTSTKPSADNEESLGYGDEEYLDYGDEQYLDDYGDEQYLDDFSFGDEEYLDYGDGEEYLDDGSGDIPL
jgi:hypothetical protein